MRRGLRQILTLPCEQYLLKATWQATANPEVVLLQGVRAIRSKRPTLQIELRRDIMQWPECPPTVRCDATWIRQELDWHVLSGARLCWCLPEQWKDVQGWCGKSRDAIATDGLRWLFGSVNLLLERHLVGHFRKLDAWPEEWTQWSHGCLGVQEYEQERKRQHGSR